MARSKSIEFKMNGTSIVTDANGIAVQILSVRHNHGTDSKPDKRVHPTESPFFRPTDFSEVEGDEKSMCVVLPEGWSMDTLRKALNQGANLISQQSVHAKFAPTSDITANREAVIAYCFSNITDPDVITLMKNCAGKSMKEINALRDKFYADFLKDDE